MKAFKGNEDMIRIVAIAAAFLIMFVIIGISIHSINNVDKINQKQIDKQNGKEFAASIAQTTATTSIWEALRTTTVTVVFSDNEGNPIPENPDESAQFEQPTNESTDIVIIVD